MIKEIKLNFKSSVNLLTGIMKIISPEEEILKNAAKDRGFIKFRTPAAYAEYHGYVASLLEKHGVSYRLKSSTPFGVHILNLKDQTMPLYNAYEETVFLSCDKAARKPPEYTQGGTTVANGITYNVIPGFVKAESHILSTLKEQTLLTYQSISKYLEKNVSLSPMASLFHSQVLYLDGQKMLSFAWYLFAMTRALADANKCTDISCMDCVSTLPFNFHHQLGGLSQKWSTDKAENKDYIKKACRLFEQYPQTSHCPDWLADQGIRNYGRAFGVELSSEDRFKPEAECVEIDRKALAQLRQLVAKEDTVSDTPG